MSGALRGRLAELVSAATEGQLTEAEVLSSPDSLTALGVGSLAFLRLVDALEDEFGVLLDLADPDFYTQNLDGLAARVGQRPAAGAGHG